MALRVQLVGSRRGYNIYIKGNQEVLEEYKVRM
jgi:hypothetical protein